MYNSPNLEWLMTFWGIMIWVPGKTLIFIINIVPQGRLHQHTTILKNANFCLFMNMIQLPRFFFFLRLTTSEFCWRGENDLNFSAGVPNTCSGINMVERCAGNETVLVSPFAYEGCYYKTKIKVISSEYSAVHLLNVQ